MILGAQAQMVRRLVPKGAREVVPSALAAANRRARRPARGWLVLAVLVIAGSLTWLGMIFTIERVRFVVHDPHAKTGFEMFLALGQLFGGLVLWIAPGGLVRIRLRWVASGLILLGSGTIWFAYLYPLAVTSPDFNVTMYGSLLTRTMGKAAVTIGLALASPPDPPKLAGGALLAGCAVLAGVVTVWGQTLPELIHGSTDLVDTFASARTAFPGLTSWHWTLALVPAALGIVATAGALRRGANGTLDGWLLVSVMLLAAAQFHSIFWPSLYSSVLTTTSFLRLGMTLVVIVGGVLELRAITEERGDLLAREQERVLQLEDLSERKRDFASMVAHELATPIATIGMLAQVIETDRADAAFRRDAGQQIRKEVATLQVLVEDIRSAMDVERDDFTVHLAPVSLASLVDEAVAYATAVAERHPLTIDPVPPVLVLADRQRIGQVLRNLLANAARHTQPGTPIGIRLERVDGQVRIAVTDGGPGVDPADRERIFGKFERGRHAGHEAGRGLGLYLSRRILERHGSELTLNSVPGAGASFSFVLREAP